MEFSELLSRFRIYVCTYINTTFTTIQRNLHKMVNEENPIRFIEYLFLFLKSVKDKKEGNERYT